MQTVTKKIYSILASDSQLSTLLEATVGDTKIYPSISDQFEEFPCITYEVVDGTFRSKPANTQDMVIQLNVFCKDSATYQGKEKLENIFSRVNTLLNYYFDTDPTIVYVRQANEIDQNETDRLLFHKVLRYRIWSRP